MNNFDGIIKEYARIAVDCFDGESLKCTVFFLSHCHSDHMKGLESDAFYFRLKSSPDITLYCSKVTSDLLSGDSKFKHLKPLMTVLEVQHTTTIAVPNENGEAKETVLVTLLPAGHCPGSVMFLFEGVNGNVLYTGDFRLTTDNLQQMEALFVGEQIKRIHKLYVDTTFCTRKASKLPTRTQSRDALFELLDPWLADEGSSYAIYLSCPAQFGCEFLFVELSERYKMQVHVTQNRLWKYEAVPEILDVVTVDGTTTQLHACYYKGRKKVSDEAADEVSGHGRFVLPCEYGSRKPRTVLHVRFSTMWFTECETSSDGLVHSFSDNWHRVCYSMHSSCEEITDLVRFLRPWAVHPLVVPRESNLDEVYKLLRPVLEETNGSFEDRPSVPREFGSLKNGNLVCTIESCTLDSDLVFGSVSLSSTPPKKIEIIRRNSAMSERDTGSLEWKLPISPAKVAEDSQKDSIPSDLDVVDGSESISSTPPKKRRRPLDMPEQEVGSPKWKLLMSPVKDTVDSQKDSCPSNLDSESISSTPRKKTPRRPSTVSEHERESPKWNLLISPMKDPFGSQKDSAISEWNDAESESSKCSTNYNSVLRNSQELCLDEPSRSSPLGTVAEIEAMEADKTVAVLNVPPKTLDDVDTKRLTMSIPTMATKEPTIASVLTTGDESSKGCPAKISDLTAMEEQNLVVTPSNTATAVMTISVPSKGILQTSDGKGSTYKDECADAAISTMEQTSSQSMAFGTHMKSWLLSLDDDSNSPEVIDLTIADDDDEVEVLRETKDEVVVFDDWDSTPELDVILMRQS